MNGDRTDLGRLIEALEAADTATFHAANIASSHLTGEPETEAIVAEALEANRKIRGILGTPPILSLKPYLYGDGAKVRNRGGRQFLKLSTRIRGF